MRNLYITKLTIENVRHLKNIEIPFSENEPKHLILTGQNGSGKTSVLEAMSNYLNAAATTNHLTENKDSMLYWKNEVDKLKVQNPESNALMKAERNYRDTSNWYLSAKRGIEIELNESLDSLRYAFENGEFLLAYYEATRVFKAEIPKHIENVELKDKYLMKEPSRNVFVKYLADLKVKEALARPKGNHEKADAINQWFVKLRDLLRQIFDDESLELIFDEDTYEFTIRESGKEPFGFNELSSGYAAVLDIVLDIIIRMEKYTNRSFNFNMPGIVLIDEIETHLHMALQRTIMKLLTTVFPKIQFVITTHSPFILNSVENAVIYDLQNHVLVEEGFSNIPYEGVVEGYFKADTMSAELREKFQRYKALAARQNLSDEDFEELADLEVYLDEIPDYLALGLTTEYQRLKLELEHREDL